MASIFTYEPDPPRVASPWDFEDTPLVKGQEDQKTVANVHSGPAYESVSLHKATQRSGKVTQLQAEPQEGPVEYKLHLLLRPRRKFKFTSTGSHIAGSRHSKFHSEQPTRKASKVAVDPSSTLEASTPPSSSTQQTKQHRLEQLTTQLIWRLQQSSPHHSSSASNVVLPASLAAPPESKASQTPAKLLYGLEESQGALYEIGVSDDGTLVGLAEDEMEESLNNLRAMAACLGCTVEIIRKEDVGECRWLEEAVDGIDRSPALRTGRLLVAEASIKPHFPSKRQSFSRSHNLANDGSELESDTDRNPEFYTEQLRITLTGPTMSGKSSLLGTVTTSTLDNGRGKSRSAIIKHRHEIDSGITSSVTQELLGYADRKDSPDVDVINYATENTASWIDIHGAARGGRLVFISDSAGHPRYRRTTVRSLIGWAPHWTLLCVPADDTDMPRSSPGDMAEAKPSLASAVSEMDLSGAQMELCLKLGLPLIVAITKLDLASKAALRSNLTRVLDAIKTAGRTPVILPNAPPDISETDLQSIPSGAIDAAYGVALPLLNDRLETVPIILTSAVQGTGISSLHALLHELPIYDTSAVPINNAGLVFHIEDIFNKPAEAEGVIVSGRLRRGRISIGDTGFVGPFSVHYMEDSEDSDARPRRKSSSHLPTSRSFPGALRATHSGLSTIQLPGQEWQRFRVASVRNMRLPVHTLHADQVGTVAIVPDVSGEHHPSNARLQGIRKGMVLAALQPTATSSFVAEFKREDLEPLAVGNHVMVYIASVRASAKVVSARAPDSPATLTRKGSNGRDPFDFEGVDTANTWHSDQGRETVAGMITDSNLLVTFMFDAGREFVLLGDQVLVMPGGGPGLYGGQERGEKGFAGLNGFVGKVTEVGR